MTAKEVAAYILFKCEQDDVPITNIQLQNMLYLIQRESLQTQGKPFFHEDFEAWGFGACIPSVYYAYCGFGTMPIELPGIILLSGTEDRTLEDSVIMRTRNYMPWDWEKLLRQPDSAWTKVYHNDGDKCVIPVWLIRKDGLPKRDRSYNRESD